MYEGSMTKHTAINRYPNKLSIIDFVDNCIYFDLVSRLYTDIIFWRTCYFFGFVYLILFWVTKYFAILSKRFLPLLS